MMIDDITSFIFHVFQENSQPSMETAEWFYGFNFLVTFPFEKGKDGIKLFETKTDTR